MVFPMDSMTTPRPISGIGSGSTLKHSHPSGGVPSDHHLKAATSCLEEVSRKESFPDLGELLKNGMLMARTSQPGLMTESKSGMPLLRKKKFTALPDYIFQQYDSVQCKSFMGLFPEINRAWITIDSRLYLWDYEANTGDAAINTFDDQDQIIVTVGLVKPVPGVFLEQIEYILVVATPLEIIILGVAFNTKGTTGKRGPMTLYKTDMIISSDNVNMTIIQGTPEGRIFMRGNNGQLFELQYQAEEGWFTRKIRKINHSSSALSLFTPTFLRWSTEDAIKLLALDTARKVLYTSSKENSIELIDLGEDGTSFTRVARVANLMAQAHQFAEYLSQAPIDERHFQLVSLHVTQPSESVLIHLIAVASSGHCFYFSHRRSTEWHTLVHIPSFRVNPTGLFLVAVRPPPSLPSQSVSSYNSLYQAAKIHEAHHSHGLLLASNSFSEEIDRVVVMALDAGSICQSTPKYLIQVSSFVDIEGKTWAISEVPGPFAPLQSTDFVTLPRDARESTTAQLMNELISQYHHSPRMFHLLTNSGLTTLTKQRPLDLLLQLMSLSGSQDQRVFADFFDYYGRAQACAMCLAIVCGHPATFAAQGTLVAGVGGGDMNATSYNANLASKLFFELGGKPAVSNVQQSTSTRPSQLMPQMVSGGLLGSPVSGGQSIIVYSGKRDGLALYICRIISVWKDRIFILRTGKIECAFSTDTLFSIQTNMSALDNYLRQYRHFTAPPSPDARPSGIEIDAWRAEQESLFSLHEFIRQSIETLLFLLLLSDYTVSSIAAGLTDAQRQELLTLSFESLLTTVKGRDMGKALMTSLINQQIRDDVGVDVISKTLQSQCPSICQPSDVMFYKGMEFIQSARNSPNAKQKSHHLEEALSLFMRVNNLSLEKVYEISEHFKALRFYVGVVDLALLYASQQRVIETSSTRLNANGYSDAEIRNQVHESRFECYQLIFNMLTAIHPNASKRMVEMESDDGDTSSAFEGTLARALCSSDVEFHHALYEFFIQQEWIDLLLHMSSPFLEDYLKRGKMVDLVKMDLLSRFYIRKGRFAEAAGVLAELSAFEGLTLNKRVEFLTLAVSNAKSCTLNDSSLSSMLLDDLPDRLDVAKIQLEIYNAVSEMQDLQPTGIREKLLAELNSALFDINYLYHHFAKPLELDEVTLSILYTSDHGSQGRAIVEAAWKNIVEKLKAASEGGGNLFELLAFKVKGFGRRFYPDENIFPCAFLFNLLLKVSFGHQEVGASAIRGWVSEIFSSLNVPLVVQFSILNGLFEAKLSPWSSHAGLVFLVEEIAWFLDQWMATVRTAPRGSVDRNEFPIRMIDESISKYLVTLHGDVKTLVDTLHQIQSKIRNL